MWPKMDRKRLKSERSNFLKTDVIIIGKGITGLVMSFLLHQRQIPHVLLGREEKQGPLALGETLPPSALPLLQSLELLPLFEEHALKKTTGYHSAWGSAQVTDHNFYFNRPFQHGLKLNKEQLLLALEVLQKEQVYPFKRLSAIKEEAEGMSVTLDDGTQIAAKFLVDATGRKRVVGKALGIAQTEYDQLMAFSTHLPRVRLPKLPHGVFVESFESGWGIVSELSEQASVMTLYTTKSHKAKADFMHYDRWPELLEHTDYLKSFLSPVEGIKVMGGNANTTLLSSCAGKNWLAIGDAAMAFDPLSSHGITSGIYTAHQAADAIAKSLENGNSDALIAYAERLEKIFGGYLEQKKQLYAQEKRWESGAFWEEMG